jgi:hypothetical protein
MKQWISAALIVTLAVGTAAAQPDLATTELEGGGSWKVDGEAKRSSRQWDLDLQRAEDGTITGTIRVDGSPLLSEGRVQGKLDGNLISGAIVGEDGERAATFTGLLANGRFQGKYTDRTGETGEWEWEGKLP